MSDQNKSIIIFDGNCRFCNSVVNWLKKKDKKERFDFIPIQAQAARDQLRKFGISFIDLQTIFLIDSKQVWVRSQAVFRIFSYLRLPYRVLSFFKFLPVFLTDFVYKQISRIRHKLK